MSRWRLGDPPPARAERDRLDAEAAAYLGALREIGGVRLTPQGLVEIVKRHDDAPDWDTYEAAYALRRMRESLLADQAAAREAERVGAAREAEREAADRAAGLLAELRASLRLARTTQEGRALVVAATFAPAWGGVRDVRLRAELARLGHALRGSGRVRLDDYQRAAPRALARAWLVVGEAGPSAAAASL